ncbi:hypothetical protein TNCV_1440891 [Trichonephila clavipes]|nr:hypothetical protein TNCV_1440891 [Trichonephila clavipes]
MTHALPKFFVIDAFLKTFNLALLARRKHFLAPKTAVGPPRIYRRFVPAPRHRLIAVASLGRLSRNRSIPVWFTRYPRTALSDGWRSLGITSLMNIGGIRYVHIHSYIGHHDQAATSSHIKYSVF